VRETRRDETRERAIFDGASICEYIYILFQKLNSCEYREERTKERTTLETKFYES
jgi:hypothetical protein